ncbi:ectonucleotide pyrophosphatase/phosphodiesterase [Pontibacter sp. G13]|uniref:alkaline phosphatase family protein n=1 Tax=Pontibacter sp. G13 TaxID=3074898 RepID=UPI00288C239D|nr:ectonucleotide pyrophosphatase/phosphodiesterase [Pontibacter sp. G13]WNJ16781.1 ectonucleotide pyrophosphatase/phosphodiesterase [Pontibacter sp. G13]
MNFRYLIYALAGLLTACQSATSPPPGPGTNADSSQTKPYLVMVSIDGFRASYWDEYESPHLHKIASQGVRAEAMRPSYPASTFPNHYTLVTGMYPGTHGLVNNSFYDEEMKEAYSMRDKEKVQDGAFYGGVPLWSLAEQQHMVSASFFWVGSEAEIAGHRPTYYKQYDGSVSNAARVDTIGAWLELPDDRRPHVLFLYFSIVDSRGHRYGPNSPEVQEAILEVDEQIGRLNEILDQHRSEGKDISLIVTADHGMCDVDTEDPAYVEDYIDIDQFEVSRGSTLWMLYSDDSTQIAQAYADLKANPSDKFDVYLRNEVPEHLHFRHPTKVGDIVCIAREPWQFARRMMGYTPGTGQHGFDPYTYSDMGALFVVQSSQLPAGTIIPPFDNIHVYPLAAHLLQLNIPTEIDGDIGMWESLLSE